MELRILGLSLLETARLMGGAGATMDEQRGWAQRRFVAADRQAGEDKRGSSMTERESIDISSHESRRLTCQYWYSKYHQQGSNNIPSTEVLAPLAEIK